MPNFEISVRAVILNKGKILLCQRKDRSYYFLPGGHVEYGEKAERALKRELKEELNILTDKLEYIGIIENIYKDKEDQSFHHELNLVFYVRTENATDKTPEDHLEFFWLNIKKLKQTHLEPIALKKALLKWLKNEKQFWGSEK